MRSRIKVGARVVGSEACSEAGCGRGGYDEERPNAVEQGQRRRSGEGKIPGMRGARFRGRG
jgi:hypothetical protein